MLERTRKLWSKQDQHQGDRQRLFTAVADAVDAEQVLYAGSYVDLAPSFCWPSVTYVDVDKRANQFFADTDGIEELIAENGADPSESTVRFIHADYNDDLDLADESQDLVISLYAGLISAACTKHLKIGGHLLVNSSHGDAALASIDPRYELSGVVVASSGDYRVKTTELATYLIPKKAVEITAELIRRTGRGIGYTKSPFAYLFERVA